MNAGVDGYSGYTQQSSSLERGFLLQRIAGAGLEPATLGL